VMLTWIKETLKSSLFSGVHAVRRTRDEDILDLMRKLRPQDCGIELIRAGGSGDGGYLIPDDLDGVEYCFSPGVGPSSDFENQMADRGIRCFLADYSVESPSICRPEFTFDKKFLGVSDGDRYFTLSTWKDKYLKDYAGDLLLQMDIEGAEYAVILSTPDEVLDQFRIAAIEFHDMDRLFDPLTFMIFSAIFEKLLRLFHVVHIHPGNFCGTVKKGKIEIPILMEFTFLNKRRVHKTTPQLTFPHKLDADNRLAKSIILPKCWYSFR
jgi:hypothetical protein